MGLYDFINGEQVKIFYTPIFDENCPEEPTWHSGGTMSDYNNGDEVILKTYYYNRPKNFVVIDEHENGDSAIIHIIKDGKVYGTFTLKDVDEKDILNTELVIGYYGCPIKITSKEDIYSYLDAKKEKNQKISRVCEYTDKLLFDYITPLGRILGELNRDGAEDDFIRKSRKEKVYFIVKNFAGLKDIPNVSENLLQKLDMKSIDELKNIDINNDCNWENLKTIIKGEMDVFYNKYLEQFKKEKKKNEPILQNILSEYNNKWIPENKNKNEQLFGEILYCFITAYESRNNDVVKNIWNPYERYLKIKEVLKNNISKDPTIVDSYIKWLGLSESETDNLNNYIKIAQTQD